MGNVALEVPLTSLSFGGDSQRNHPDDTMAQSLRDPSDDTPLARGVTTLEDDGHLEALTLDPLLQIDQIFLKLEELAVV